MTHSRPAKAGTLKTLEQNVCHAEAFESALRDQTSMAGASDNLCLAINILQTEEHETGLS